MVNLQKKKWNKQANEKNDAPSMSFIKIRINTTLKSH